MAPLFSITRAAELVGRTGAAIRDAEKDGRLPAVERTATGRRVGYTLAEINQMRAVFGTQPWGGGAGGPAGGDRRAELQGRRRKIHRIGPSGPIPRHQGLPRLPDRLRQPASATTMFGYVPRPRHRGGRNAVSLHPQYRDVELGLCRAGDALDGLFLVPANLKLYQAEYELAARIARADRGLLNRLAQGIASIEQHFDVVILDPPPALGTISLSVMRAANALLVPIPPTVVDFTSTTTFLAMLYETMGVLEEQGLPIELRWMRMLATRGDEQKSMQRELMGVMRSLFGENLLRTVLKDSAEIDNASARLMTVYDLDRPVTSRDTYQRCLTYLNGVNAEVETLVRLTWPSHAARLRAEGIL